MRSVLHRPLVVCLLGTAVIAGAIGVANAAYNPSAPPYPADPNNVTSLTIYDSTTGAVVSSGSNATTLDHFFFAAATDFNPGHTKAAVSGYLAEAGKQPGDFSGEALGAGTTYPVMTAPAPVNGFTAPVAKGGTSSSFASLTSDLPNNAGSTSDFYELYQLRVKTTFPSPQSDTYAFADIQIDPKAGTWKVVNPPPAATATPTATPTATATASPTVSPTASPTVSPTASPTVSPTASPTASPTVAPTASPTATQPTGGQTSVGLNPQPNLITYGQTFRISGRVFGFSTGTQRLYLSSTTNGKTVRQTIYATNGAFNETIKPLYSAQYTVMYVGDDTHAASTSPVQRTLVATRVVRNGQSVSGRSITFKGTISPVLPGEVVNLAAVQGNRSMSLGSAKTARNGTFTITGHLPAGTSSVYALIGNTSNNSYGSSEPVSVTVR